MAIDRRTFVSLLGGLCAAGGRAGFAQDRGAARYITASSSDDGRHRISIVDGDSGAHTDIDLPGRGHGVALAPDGGRAVAFARRPGRFAVAFAADGTLLDRIDSAPGRHFYGHGAFSPDGRLLYATENDFDGGRGVIGVYAAADGYRRLAEFPTPGIGPHEIRLMHDGRTLAIAVGGIETHPDAGRAKLNLATMAPSLTLMDRLDPDRPVRFSLPAELHQASIRHLDVGANGVVVFAMQYEGPKSDLVPLVAVKRPRGPIAFLRAPEEVERRMRNYCGSVRIDSLGTVVAVSAPRGGLIAFWDIASGDFLTHLAVPDGCGVAPTGATGTFLISSGLGELVIFDAGRRTVRRIAAANAGAPHWDNHLTRFGDA